MFPITLLSGQYKGMVLDIDSVYDKQGSPLSEGDSSYRRSREMQGERVEALCRRAGCLRPRSRKSDEDAV